MKINEGKQGMIPLLPGDMLVMTGTSQQHLMHRTLPKSKIKPELLLKYPLRNAALRSSFDALTGPDSETMWSKYPGTRCVITLRQIVNHKKGCPVLRANDGPATNDASSSAAVVAEAFSDNAEAMPVQSGALRDCSTSSQRQRGCRSQGHDADSPSRKKPRTMQEQVSDGPDWDGTTSPDDSASVTDGDVSRSDSEPEPTTNGHTTSPVRNLVPAMLGDARTIKRRGEDDGHSLTTADNQRLMDLLPKASAEVLTEARELVRSQFARVKDLANGMFLLRDTLAVELQKLEHANRDVQSSHQPLYSEYDRLLNSLNRSRLEQFQDSFTRLEQSHLQEVQRIRAVWQQRVDDSKRESCGRSQNDIAPVSPTETTVAMGLPLPPPVPISIVREKDKLSQVRIHVRVP